MFIVKPKQFDLIEIKWHDSIAYNQTPWFELDYVLDQDQIAGMTIHSIGYFLEENKEYIIFTDSIRPNEEPDEINYVGMCHVIPRGCIQELKCLASGLKTIKS